MAEHRGRRHRRRGCASSSIDVYGRARDARREAGHPHRRHEVGVRPGRAGADRPRRRGPDARLLPLLGRLGLRARPAPAAARQAAGTELAGRAGLGPRARPPPFSPRRWSPVRRRPTARSTAGSPARPLAWPTDARVAQRMARRIEAGAPARGGPNYRAHARALADGGGGRPPQPVVGVVMGSDSDLPVVQIASRPSRSSTSRTRCGSSPRTARRSRCTVRQHGSAERSEDPDRRRGWSRAPGRCAREPDDPPVIGIPIQTATLGAPTPCTRRCRCPPASPSRPWPSGMRARRTPPSSPRRSWPCTTRNSTRVCSSSAPSSGGA